MRQSIILSVIIAALACGSFLIGRSAGKRAALAALKPQVDTMVVHDTTRVSTPVEVAHTVVREKVVEVPVYIHTSDTVIQTIYLPREERIYKDSTYMAVVSGVDPSLDYMEVYARTQTITKTIEKAVKVKPKWSVGIQLGAGVVVPFSTAEPTFGGYAGVGLTKRF